MKPNTQTSNHTPEPWYAKPTSAGQSIIASEATGATVAVAYDPKDGPLLAAAPELLAALETIASIAEGDGLDAMRPFSEVDIMTKWAREAEARVARGVFMSISGSARAAIAKATGNA